VALYCIDNMSQCVFEAKMEGIVQGLEQGVLAALALGAGGPGRGIASGEAAVIPGQTAAAQSRVGRWMSADEYGKMRLLEQCKVAPVIDPMCLIRLNLNPLENRPSLDLSMSNLTYPRTRCSLEASPGGTRSQGQTRWLVGWPLRGVSLFRDFQVHRILN